MLDALGNAVLDAIHDAYDVKARKQGAASSGWLVIDFGSVIVHLFSPDQRAYYQLEDFWKEGKVLLRLQ